MKQVHDMTREEIAEYIERQTSQLSRRTKAWKVLNTAAIMIRYGVWSPTLKVFGTFYERPALYVNARKIIEFNDFQSALVCCEDLRTALGIKRETP